VRVRDVFSIALICSGNRFRSPLAAAFIERLSVGFPVELQTAGTLEIVGAPVLPEARHVAVLCGLDLLQHRSRPLSHLHLEGVDLVLGFEEHHVRRAIIDAGAIRARSFTFREIVDLLANITPPDASGRVHRARLAVAAANESRRTAGGLTAGGADVADPFGRPPKVYRDTAAEIRELSLALVDHLLGERRATLLPIPERLPGPGWLTRSRRSFMRRRRRRSA
jgi:protein-tyrosine-phosphatase